MLATLRGALAALLLLTLLPTAQAQDAERRVAGELIVRLAPDAHIAELTADPAPRAEGLTAKRLLVPALNVWLVGFAEADRATEAAAREVLTSVRRSSAVRVAQFNHEVTLRSAEAAPAAPNDARFGEMWGLNNTGQSGGTPGADVSALEAWGLTTGGLTADGDRVAVAIVDSGFDLNHPDLRYWTNTAETPGNGVDDDANGYVDDVNGWSAYTSSGLQSSGGFFGRHGTHVAGTAATRGDNGIGTTGVNWEALTVAIEGSSGNEATVIEAYGYALALRTQYDATGGAEGAFVVATNSSFGVNFGNPSSYPIWCGFYDDLGQAGILSAAATMNINANVDTDNDVPTACPSDYMIAVTNTTRDDRKNLGAAYGLTTIDLGAPGTSILSTVPGNSYSTLTGTSMATPHVAGAVGLLVSSLSGAQLQDYKANPAAFALTLKQALLDGADDIGLQTVTGGRLNLYQSLLLIQDNGSGSVTVGIAPAGTTAIPAGGGLIAYAVTLTNGTAEAQTVTAEVGATLPDGSAFGPLQGPTSVTLAAGQTLGPVAFSEGVPASAPAGLYTVTLSLSSGASASFTFEKTGGASLLAQAEPAAGAYPNPFWQATTLRYALEAPADVRLAVYDVLGREVAVLAEGAADAGAHEATFDARGLAAGVYLWRLEAGAMMQTGRLTLAR